MSTRLGAAAHQPLVGGQDSGFAVVGPLGLAVAVGIASAPVVDDTLAGHGGGHQDRVDHEGGLGAFVVPVAGGQAAVGGGAAEAGDLVGVQEGTVHGHGGGSLPERKAVAVPTA